MSEVTSRRHASCPACKYQSYYATPRRVTFLYARKGSGFMPVGGWVWCSVHGPQLEGATWK
jgi:hypothetical protein